MSGAQKRRYGKDARRQRDNCQDAERDPWKDAESLPMRLRGSWKAPGASKDAGKTLGTNQKGPVQGREGTAILEVRLRRMLRGAVEDALTLRVPVQRC